MKGPFKLADSVWHRVVQIIQEGMLSQTDVSDGLRMVTLTTDENDPNTLVLTSQYKTQVEKIHLSMEEEAKTLREGRNKPVGDA